MEGTNITNELFSDLREQYLESVTLTECTFIGTNASGAKLIDCVFEQSTLSLVKLDGAVVQAKFVASKIEGINFFTAKRSLLYLSFENCLIRYSSFAELKLKEAKFTGCTLQDVDFSDADLTQADFSNSSFTNCVFRNTNLSKADFRGARGYSIDPTGNKVKGARFDIPEVLGLLDAFEINLS
jgi:fluoroquinolone resistance protein